MSPTYLLIKAGIKYQKKYLNIEWTFCTNSRIIFKFNSILVFKTNTFDTQITHFHSKMTYSNRVPNSQYLITDYAPPKIFILICM